VSKRLPRTSRRTLDDLRKAAKSALEAEDLPHRTAQSDEPAKSTEEEPAPLNPDRQEKPSRTRAAEHSAQAPLPVTVAAPFETRSRPTRAAFRQASGKLIVERHANLATVAGLIPMPWVDLVAISAIVDRMLRRLSRLYGQPLDGTRSKQLATSMLTGMAAPGIASFATTGLMSMMPGPNLVATAITSISAAVLVRIVGEVYLAHLAGLAGDTTATSPNTAIPTV
jgi:uncharacterized protein (DUF697 family)